MKQLKLLALALVSTAALAGPSTREAARMTEIRLDPRLSYAQQVNAASVVVDRAEDSVTLVLNRRMSCPPGQMCPMVMPAPIVIKMHITDVTTDGCRSTVITASLDRRPVDGDLKAIKIVDHRNRICRDARRFGTDVEFRTVSSGFNPQGIVVSTRSFLGGEHLHPVVLY